MVSRKIFMRAALASLTHLSRLKGLEACWEISLINSTYYLTRLAGFKMTRRFREIIRFLPSKYAKQFQTMKCNARIDNPSNTGRLISLVFFWEHKIWKKKKSTLVAGKGREIETYRSTKTCWQSHTRWTHIPLSMSPKIHDKKYRN